MGNAAIRVGAAVIVSEGRELLLGRRTKPPCGQWVFPGGGVRFCETLEAAAIREAKEETGLDVDIVGSFGTYSIIAFPKPKPWECGHPDCPCTGGRLHDPEPGDHRVVAIFLASRKWRNQAIVAGGDLDEARFVTIDEIDRRPSSIALTRFTRRVFCELLARNEEGWRATYA